MPKLSITDSLTLVFGLATTLIAIATFFIMRNRESSRVADPDLELNLLRTTASTTALPQGITDNNDLQTTNHDSTVNRHQVLQAMEDTLRLVSQHIGPRN